MLDDNHDSERLTELGSTVEVYADRLASVERYDGLAHLVFELGPKNRRDRGKSA